MSAELDRYRSNHGPDVQHHIPVLESEDTKVLCRKIAITFRIPHPLPWVRMDLAIHFDDETSTETNEICYVRTDCHLTAEMLYDEAMRAKVPVSLATVYNTLHQFTEAGLLRQLALDGSKAYFDTNPSEHHHFYLEEEGAVIDMPDCGITVDSLPEAPEGMEIAGVEVIVRLRRSRPAGRRQQG